MGIYQMFRGSDAHAKRIRQFDTIAGAYGLLSQPGVDPYVSDFLYGTDVTALAVEVFEGRDDVVRAALQPSTPIRRGRLLARMLGG
ncbi:MAG: hypothetical protein HY053_03750 [Proteobacteria bacterium]|nr:hypothetical protein [Pseudomonadota bacterium]